MTLRPGHLHKVHTAVVDESRVVATLVPGVGISLKLNLKLNLKLKLWSQVRDLVQVGAEIRCKSFVKQERGALAQRQGPAKKLLLMAAAVVLK